MRFLVGATFGFMSAALWGQQTVALAELDEQTKTKPFPEGFHDKTWGTKWTKTWHPGMVDKSHFPKGQVFTHQLVMIRVGQYENERVADDSSCRLTQLNRGKQANT